MSKHYIKDFSKVALPATSKGNGPDTTFDVIIVGGGTAGCTLAARLSEDPSISVLLLEAGGSGRMLFTTIPSAFSKLFRNSKYVFQYRTEPQENARNLKKFWPRAKMLGGCSSINAQMAQYGAPGDFDEWAKIIGDEGWNWNNFGQCFRKFEKYTPNPNYPNVATAFRGSNGPVEIGYNGHYGDSAKDFVESCVNKGIPLNYDFNTTEGPNGVNRIMTYIDKSVRRVSSETAYLTAEVLERPNLKVVINATVTKILIRTSNGQTSQEEKKVVGVEFALDKKGKVWRAKAREEVVLCGGAINSPQILLLSGVGPSEHLSSHNIEVIHDLPGVGQHLVDHPVVDFWYKDKSKQAPNFLLPRGVGDVIAALKDIGLYYMNGNANLATGWGEAVSFVRSDDPTLFPPAEYPTPPCIRKREEGKQTIQDSTSGPKSPDLEIFITVLAYKNHGKWSWKYPTFALHACLLRPLSRGELRLKSASPWDHPTMDPKYLSSEDDLAKLVLGSRFCLNLARTEPINSRIDHTDQDGLDGNTYLKTDEELEELIKDRVETLYHPAGTCRMAPLEDGGVVDSRLRVYGIKGLRVCDASIFSEIVSGHTAGASIAIGEKCAEILKEELRGTNKRS
ncbi:alcohol oxidase [Marasmius fiardii PR-910]|nr:alcohol oxidase [Marasmius fiardii PR-910]